MLKETLQAAMPSMRRIILASAFLVGSAVGFEQLAGFKMPSLQGMQKAAQNKAKFGDKKLAIVTGTSSGADPAFLLPAFARCPRIPVMIACLCTSTLGPCLMEADTRVALEQVLGVRRQRRCCALASIMSLEQCATSTKWRPLPS